MFDTVTTFIDVAQIVLTVLIVGLAGREAIRLSRPGTTIPEAGLERSATLALAIWVAIWVGVMIVGLWVSILSLIGIIVLKLTDVAVVTVCKRHGNQPPDGRPGRVLKLHTMVFGAALAVSGATALGLT